jgi:RNA polymerase sigma-70 factor (ECF subfamily)
MATGLEYDCGLDELPTGGNASASELFRQHRDKLLRMISFRMDRRLLGKIDAEDVLQDAFVEVVRRFDSYLARPTVPAFVWIRQIARQALINLHRRYLGAQMRDVHQETDAYWAGGADHSSAFLAAQLADSLTTPSQRVVRAEAVAAVAAAMERLEPIDREVLVLRHLEELSNNEVAQVLNIDRFAASKRYLRALARLKRMMPAEP